MIIDRITTYGYTNAFKHTIKTLYYLSEDAVAYLKEFVLHEPKESKKDDDEETE